MVDKGARISKPCANLTATAINLTVTAVPVALGLVYQQRINLCMALFVDLHCSFGVRSWVSFKPNGSDLLFCGHPGKTFLLLMA